MRNRIYKDYLVEKFDDKGRVIDIRYKTPENFNFGYDIIDRLAVETPDKKALIWCNEFDEEKIFTFADLKRESDKTAAFFQSIGITKGDTVMLILKRHYEWWFSMIALHKIGAIAIPATNQLMVKDIIYRCNAASVKAIICTADGEISSVIDAASSQCPTLTIKIITRQNREGWIRFDEGVAKSGEFVRPTGDLAPKAKEMMLLYFSSGTTGMPKMVGHNHYYALGHIPTAVYWHNVDPDGIHLTVSETGWGKAVWGKFYGQWIAETAVFVFDFERFHAEELLKRETLTGEEISEIVLGKKITAKKTEPKSKKAKK